MVGDGYFTSNSATLSLSTRNAPKSFSNQVQPRQCVVFANWSGREGEQAICKVAIEETTQKVISVGDYQNSIVLKRLNLISLDLAWLSFKRAKSLK